MKIKEIEALTGLTRANIRFYESKGLFTPERRENNYREYTDADVEILRKIALLRKMGISIEDLKKLFDGELALDQALANARQSISEQLEELNGALQLCQLMQFNGETMDTLAPERYEGTLRQLERQGETFPSLLGDIAEDYREDFLPNWLVDTDEKHPLRTLAIVLGSLAALDVANLVIGKSASVLDYLRAVIAPVCGLLIASAFYFLLRVLARKHPKLDKKIRWIYQNHIAFGAIILLIVAVGILIWLSVSTMLSINPNAF